jgi:hypothetical protein
VQEKHYESLAEDLSVKFARQESEIKQLHKRCQGLENALKQLKKDKQQTAVLSEATGPIAVVTNNGRYSSSTQSKPDTLSLSPTTVSTTPSHVPPPSFSPTSQQAEPALDVTQGVVKVT